MELQPRTQRFEQVKSALITSILEGQLAPGDRLPSMRTLSLYFRVSLATIQRAAQELEDEEWLVAASRKGVVVADPLPPIAHLMRLKQQRQPRSPSAPETPDHAVGAARNGTLTCLIHDEALLPVFEWAAREYADAYSPCALRFEVQSLRGRDDEESVRSLDADLVLLPVYAVSRAVRAGAVTPDEGMLSQGRGCLDDVPPEVQECFTWDGKLWGVPLMAGGAALFADEERCRRLGIDREQLTSVESVVAALEQAARAGVGDDTLLFNWSFLTPLLMSAGMEFPTVVQMPDVMTQPAVRALLERFRELAGHPASELKRFDRWDTADFPRVAIRQEPTTLFCRGRENRGGVHALPIPGPEGGRVVWATYGLCVSARSVHPFEAWEWAVRLAEAPFQSRLARIALDVPVSLHPDVQRAFAAEVGEVNARTLQGLLPRVSDMYNVGSEDRMRYSWEVFGNELYRFVSGMNDYERMLERLKAKTERYLLRAVAEDAPEAVAAETAR